VVMSYVVIVPVKPPSFGKSRIVGLEHPRRRDLARAFALDTVAACLASEHVAQVLVATDDAAFSRELTALGCATVPDGDTRDLNAALHQAAAEARRRWPDLVPAALLADLPALRPSDLGLALASFQPDGPSFVADSERVGTTLYTAPYDRFAPRFGADSRHGHLASGALELGLDVLTLRRDVDDLEDLREAVALGVGAETALVVAELGLA
jgi:2-phospho-L-lactate guanylyltransferase